MAEIEVAAGWYKRASVAQGNHVSTSNRRTGKPAGGNGYLAGSYPDGITSVDGVPVPAIVRIHLRAEYGAPGDGMLIAQVQSAPDGTWGVYGLDPALKFDVVGRKNGFNDVIMADISPTPY